MEKTLRQCPARPKSQIQHRLDVKYIKFRRRMDNNVWNPNYIPSFSRVEKIIPLQFCFRVDLPGIGACCNNVRWRQGRIYSLHEPAGLLHEQGQEVQPVRIGQQSLGGDDQDARCDRGRGDACRESLRGGCVAVAAGTNAGGHRANARQGHRGSRISDRKEVDGTDMLLPDRPEAGQGKTLSVKKWAGFGGVR
jgi:hypothetical protein